MSRPPPTPVRRGRAALHRFRGLLLSLLVALPMTLAPGAALWAKEPAPSAPEHVVLLLVGGGVRARDLLDARMTAVKALAEKGSVVDAVASPRRNAWLATQDLLTGRTDAPETEGRQRPAHPTLFEHLRAQPGARAEDVWLCVGAPGDDERLGASSDAAFGPSVGARVASGLGALGEPLRGFLEDLGRPLPVAEGVWPLLRRLRALNRQTAGPFLPDDVDAGTAEAERVERAALAELDRRALLVKAPNVEDERALRAALTVLAVHRPRLLAVRLTGAQAGLESLARYEEALLAADRGLERLRAAVDADPRLQGRTTFVVATDVGRNAKPGAGGALGMDDDSADRRTAVVVLAGPGVKTGARVKGPRTLADVAPTLGRLLSVALPGATGRAWDEVLRLP